MLTMGFVDYINSYPLTASFRLNAINPEAKLHYAIPSALNQMLKKKQLDASFVSLAEFLEGKKSRYTQVPYFGIAAEQKILSVNFYLQNNLSSLDGKCVALTDHSATSSLLLKILCRHFWNIAPKFEMINRNTPITDYAGILLIGDEALKYKTLDGFSTVDLAEVWYHKTHLPFVFAVFAYQKTLSLVKKRELEAFVKKLDKSLKWAKLHPALIEKLARDKTHLPNALIKKYYKMCHFRLGERHKKAINLFEKYSDEILCSTS